MLVHRLWRWWSSPIWQYRYNFYKRENFAVLLCENGINSIWSGLAQADDKEEKRPESKAANLDLCLWPGLAMPSDGIAENEISPDIRGKSLMNDHDNDNLEKGEPSRSPTDVQNLEMLEAVEILISLSRGSKKI